MCGPTLKAMAPPCACAHVALACTCCVRTSTCVSMVFVRAACFGHGRMCAHAAQGSLRAHKQRLTWRQVGRDVLRQDHAHCLGHVVCHDALAVLGDAGAHNGLQELVPHQRVLNVHLQQDVVGLRWEGQVHTRAHTHKDTHTQVHKYTYKHTSTQFSTPSALEHSNALEHGTDALRPLHAVLCPCMHFQTL